jgi:hypothetical protein
MLFGVPAQEALCARENLPCQPFRIRAKLHSMKRKNPAAVALGKKGGKASVESKTPEQRKALAHIAAKARWAGKKKKAS